VNESPRFALDHLVVAAASLEAGADWCRRVLGATAVPGGRHPTMATHNLLLGLASPRFPRSYLEIIAIDPAAVPPERARWFDLDDPALRAAVGREPQLVHWVARTADIAAAAQILRDAGHDPGVAVAAERATPGGVLRWKILLREDGRRLAAGAVPLVIEWADAHPTDALAASGVALEQVEIAGVSAALATSLGVRPGGGPAALAARLMTPQGVVTLAVAPLSNDG